MSNPASAQESHTTTDVAATRSLSNNDYYLGFGEKNGLAFSESEFAAIFEANGEQAAASQRYTSISAFDARIESIQVLMPALENWSKLNSLVIEYFENGWQNSGSNPFLDTRVVDTRKSIGRSSLDSVLSHLISEHFTDGQESEVVTVAERVKNEIATACKSDAEAILETCKKNRDSADAALSTASIKLSFAKTDREQCQRNYESAKATWERSNSGN